MKQACIICERKSVDGNLWCQDADCPVGKMPHVFGYGEPFVDLEIVKLLVVLRSSALYEAVRGDQRVYLKIAHDGHHERLKREAEFLQTLQRKKNSHPMLPKLLPAHRDTDHAYGKSAFRGRMKYYSVFEHCEGDLLRELLQKNPQPWFKHVGWIALSLTDVFGFLHQENCLHLALCPECCLIRFDRDDVPRLTLLDLGAVSDPQRIALHWSLQLAPTAYTAPELFGTNPQANSSTDVYGIGLQLYEMLAGHPAHEFRLRDEDSIRRDIMQSTKHRVNRDELNAMPRIAERATQMRPQARHQNILELSQDLSGTVSPLPRERSRRRVEPQTVLVLLGAAIIIPMLLAIAIFLSDLPAF